MRQTAADIVLDTKAKVFFPSEGGEREVAFRVMRSPLRSN